MTGATRRQDPDVALEPDSGTYDGTLVLDKVVRILDLLLSSGGSSAPQVIASELHLTKSTAYRLLRNMARAGLVDREATGQFRLGSRLISYGLVAGMSLEVRREAEAPLFKLAHETSQTSFLFVPRGDEAVCILRVAGRDIELLAVAEQGALPLHAGAGPKAILAALSDDDIARIATQELRQLTPLTTVQRISLLREVSETRARGYSLSREDVTLGVGAIGAPILDARSVVVGSVSIGGITAHLDAKHDDYAAAVVRCASAISRRLGHVSRTANPYEPGPIAGDALLGTRR